MLLLFGYLYYDLLAYEKSVEETSGVGRFAGAGLLALSKIIFINLFISSLLGVFLKVIFFKLQQQTISSRNKKYFVFAIWTFIVWPLVLYIFTYD